MGGGGNPNHDDHGRFGSGNGSGGKAGSHEGHAGAVPSVAQAAKAGATIAKTGNPATSAKALESSIKGLPAGHQAAARAAYQGAMKSYTPAPKGKLF